MNAVGELVAISIPREVFDRRGAGNSLYLLGGHSGLVDFEAERAAIGDDGAL